MVVKNGGDSMVKSKWWFYGDSLVILPNGGGDSMAQSKKSPTNNKSSKVAIDLIFPANW